MGTIKGAPLEKPALWKWWMTSLQLLCQELSLEVGEQHPPCCGTSCVTCHMFGRACAVYGVKRLEPPNSHEDPSTESPLLQLSQVPFPWSIMRHTFRSPEPNSWRWNSQFNGEKHVDTSNWSPKRNSRNNLVADGFEASNLAELGSICEK